MSECEPFEGGAIPVQEPGEYYDGTVVDAMRDIFGASEEALTQAASRIDERLGAITENEREAARISRDWIIGRTALS